LPLKDFDVILNCVGPFYEYGTTLLSAAIEAGVNYVDVCDDCDATAEQLKMDGDGKKSGIKSCYSYGKFYFYLPLPIYWQSMLPTISLMKPRL